VFLVFEEAALLERTQELVDFGWRGTEEGIGIKAGLETAMVALDDIGTRGEVENRGQEIVKPHESADVEFAAVFSRDFGKETVAGDEADVFVITPDEENLIGVGEFETEKCVEDLDAVATAIGVIAEKSDADVGFDDPESVEVPFVVEGIEVAEQGVDIAMEIAVEENPSLGGNDMPLSKGLERSGGLKVIGGVEVKELGRLRGAAEPGFGAGESAGAA